MMAQISEQREYRKRWQQRTTKIELCSSFPCCHGVDLADIFRVHCKQTPAFSYIKRVEIKHMSSDSKITEQSLRSEWVQ
jgi:hypothetical protein